MDLASSIGIIVIWTFDLSPRQYYAIFASLFHLTCAASVQNYVVYSTADVRCVSLYNLRSTITTDSRSLNIYISLLANLSYNKNIYRTSKLVVTSPLAYISVR